MSSIDGTRETHSTHVVHLTEATGGGVRRHLQLIVPELASRGVWQDIIALGCRQEPGFADDLEHYRSLGVRSQAFPISRVQLLAGGGVRACRDLLREWNADILHCHATIGGVVGRRAARGIPELRTVYAPHALRFLAYPPGPRFWAFLQLERWLAKRTDAFVAVSQHEKDVICEALNVEEDRVALAENGLPESFPQKVIDKATAREVWGVPEDAFVIGVPGRLCHQKGQDLVLEALPSLADSLPPNYRVVFCGGGPWEKRLRHLAEELGVSDRVLWVGYDPGLTAKLSALDLAVLPSRYEGLSYTFLETLWQGVPLIASHMPANLPRRQLTNLISTFPPGDSRALAIALASFVRDGDRAQAADKAKELVRAEFALDRQIEALATLYERLSRPGVHS